MTAPPTGYDVAVIGAGVVGCAIARELAAYRLSVVLIEAREDVGDGTSKANTAILHTGFDATPGTLESRLVRRGYDLLGSYADVVGIPIERTGAILVAWEADQCDALPALQAKAVENGYDRTRIVSPQQVYAEVPSLRPGALGGLVVPDESIVCGWTTTLALATEAVLRGVDLRLRTRVESIDARADCTVLGTERGDIAARWVVNAAGLGSDVVDRQMGSDRFTIVPRKGELIVFDKQARPLVDRIVLPVPGRMGKGVLVSPTVYGNVMVGPTAQDVEDRTDTSTTPEGLAFLHDRAYDLVPALREEEVTAAYAGLRAATEHGDYVVAVDGDRRYAVAGGIRSTGLTSCLALAEYVRELLAEAGLALHLRDDLPEPPRMPNIGEAGLRPYRDAQRIAQDAEYGRIVCFCERVTAGEIRDACQARIPATTVGGLRRRTRAMNGRCQGFFCAAEVRGYLDQAEAVRPAGPP